MNRRTWILGIVAMALIGGTAGLLGNLRAHQKLGPPGVKTSPLLGAAPGSIAVEVQLPEKVLDYTSVWVPPDEITTNTLPRDTSYGQRTYTLPDRSFGIQARVVLMGMDRGSMHKPQYCLVGQGWRIDPESSGVTTIPMERPFPYQLSVVKLVTTKEGQIEGKRVMLRGLYVYWFVADDALSASASGFERMWLLAKKMLTTGILQRWAYVSCFSVCAPGQEDPTFERMKQFITASVPEFQLYPRASQTSQAAASISR
jgi:hypothetical protein